VCLRTEKARGEGGKDREQESGEKNINKPNINFEIHSRKIKRRGKLLAEGGSGKPALKRGETHLRKVGGGVDKRGTDQKNANLGRKILEWDKTDQSACAPERIAYHKE